MRTRDNYSYVPVSETAKIFIECLAREEGRYQRRIVDECVLAYLQQSYPSMAKDFEEKLSAEKRTNPTLKS